MTDLSSLERAIGCIEGKIDDLCATLTKRSEEIEALDRRISALERFHAWFVARRSSARVKRRQDGHCICGGSRGVTPPEHQNDGTRTDSFPSVATTRFAPRPSASKEKNLSQVPISGTVLLPTSSGNPGL